ncbi:RHS repeat-associated core domain-containing protein [Pseudomonas sp. NFACC46-3]|uniref:RHS repeat-associated core domain-containing protein n=1 Tax=unclassified Pseudomonas TaxID=196821 RepID=UPI0008713298|nr:RHS repeat-associated core domain-containing protein [Pseudomonas sp. NFACC05-1]SFL74833.1 RHS repeat-associated core domain-containing protein [Pseudomonas sp. NFACC46-3]
MPFERENLLCRYRYDPLDRLADCTPTAQVSSQRFYLKDRLATEVRGTAQCSFFQLEDQLMAQQQRQEDTVQTTFLATDHHRSVLQALNATQPWPLVYTPYGHRVPENGLLSLLGFNGERPDPVTGHYLLGNGYRAFNPVLMRFNSPDSLSPFGAGGLNSYAYCVGDPINRSDPTGHTWGPLKAVLREAGLMRQSNPVVQPAASRNPPATTGATPLQTSNAETSARTTRGIIEVSALSVFPAEDPNRGLHARIFSLIRADIRSILRTGARYRPPVVIIVNDGLNDFRGRHVVPRPSVGESPPPSYEHFSPPPYSVAMKNIRSIDRTIKKHDTKPPSYFQN